MFKRILKFAFVHILDNAVVYAVCLFCMVMGLIAGIASGLKFDNGSFLSDFFGGLPDFSSAGLIKEGIIQAFMISGVVLMLGMSPAGCVAIPVVCAYRGFAVGYTSAAVYSVYGIKSVVFIVCGILPSLIIWMPALMFGAVNGLKFSVMLFKFFRRKTSANFSNEILILLFSSIVVFFSIFLSKVIEIFFVPKMLNIVGGLYV